MSTKAAILRVLLAMMLSATAFAAERNQPSAAAAEWPNWRGPNHNGISTEKGWLTSWPKEGPKELWKVELGRSHSSVAIMAGYVYTMGRDADRDTVVCLDADTGKIVWKHVYPAADSDYGGGPARLRQSTARPFIPSARTARHSALVRFRDK